jgi:hypothetical protein
MSTLRLPSNPTDHLPEVALDRAPAAPDHATSSRRMIRFAPPQRVDRTIIIGQVLPALRGEGDVDYLCGFCEAKIVEGVDRGQLQQLAFKCPSCVRYSELPAEPEPADTGVDRRGDRLVFAAGAFIMTATITVPRAPFVLFGERGPSDA